MKHAGLNLLKTSAIIETEPYGYTDQAPFLNGACIVETVLSPRELLDQLLAIEREMGRKREIRWGPRIIDLDIIFYEDQVIQEKDLIIPHPDAHNRTFVMGPISEIAPHFVHPICQKTVREIYQELIKRS
ncbi:MAG TPA: 2-amino-4-hydroxy-6-hydroxymethyldihydropteridine diphosphokinase [Clostridiales bacterium]|nr:2-amino-4-hydroxy-6-hydroxymethyldihydropteridine diphosphokinase [Clostridiales bacterium]